MPRRGKSGLRLTASEKQAQTSSPSIFMILANNSREMRSEFINDKNKKGISQERLAEMADVSLDTIKRYESGKYEGVRLATADRIAAALGITLQELLTPQK